MKSFAIFLIMLLISTALSFPLPWFRMNHGSHQKDASVSSDSISQFLPLANSLQSTINALKSPPSSSSNDNNNLLNTIFPNGVNPVQILQIAAQVQQLQQAISSASANSASPTSSTVNIASDLLNLITLIRSPSPKSTSSQFQSDLANLIAKYVPDAQSQASLLSLIQQIKNNTLTPDSIKFDNSIPADFWVALHSLVQKYTQSN